MDMEKKFHDEVDSLTLLVKMAEKQVGLIEQARKKEQRMGILRQLKSLIDEMRELGYSSEASDEIQEIVDDVVLQFSRCDISMDVAIEDDKASKPLMQKVKNCMARARTVFDKMLIELNSCEDDFCYC